MSGVRRLSDAALGGAAAGASSGQWPVYNTAAGRYAPGTAKYDPKISVYGDINTGLRYWRGALQRLRTGTSDAKILCLGDSISTASATGNPMTNHFGAVAAQIIGGRLGLPYRRQTFDRSLAAPAEVTLNTGWTNGSSFASVLPWFTWSAAAGGTGTLDITPTIPCDGFIVYNYRVGTGTAYSYTVDGGASTNHTNSSGSFGFDAQVISAGSVGTHTLRITPPAGATAYIAGVEFTNSTARAVKWWGNGNSGATSAAPVSQMTSLTTDTTSAITALASDLIVLEFGTNDYLLQGGGSTPATLQSNLTSIVQTIQTYTRRCDVALIGWPPNGTATGSISGYTTAQSAYYAALDAVVDATGCVAFHLDQRWKDYATSSASPVSFYTDVTHPNTAGHGDIGAMLAGALVAGG